MSWRTVLGYLPANLVQALAGFGGLMVFTRLLSPADFGLYALAFSVTSLVHTLGFTWLEAAMARFWPAEPEGEAQAALIATVYRIFGVIAVAVPVAAGLLLWALPASPPLKLAAAAGLAGVVARSLLKLAQERRRAAGEVRGYVLADVLQTGGGFLLGCGLAAAGWGAASPLAGAGLASLALIALATPGELRRGRGGRLDPVRARAYAAYGLPVALSLILSLALAVTDRFVIAAFLDPAAVGAYHAGYSLSSRTLDVLFIWLGMASGPGLVRAFEAGGAEAVKAAGRQAAALMAYLALPACAGVALVAHPLAHALVGPALRDRAASVTPWIALSALLSGFTTYYFHTAFTVARRTPRLLAAMSVPAAANLALTLVLIPRFGLAGAVWATAASCGLGLAASIGLGRGCLALPLPWRDLAKAATATAVMAAVVSALPPLGSWLELACKTSAGALAYGAALLALDGGGLRGLISARLAPPAAEAAA